MKLYMMPVAPNPAKVLLYLAEKNALQSAAQLAPVAVEAVLVDFRAGEQNSAAHRERSPFGTVPVLELDDGGYLIESLAIIEYLEELYRDTTLWGDNARARAIARDLERTVATRVLNDLAEYVHSTASPLGLPPDPARAERAADRLPAVWTYLEQTLADGRPFLAGTAPTVADCTLQAALQFMRFAQLDLLEPYDALRAWDSAYRARGPISTTLIV